MKLKFLLCSYLCFLLAIGHAQTYTIRVNCINNGNNAAFIKRASNDGGSPVRNIFDYVDNGTAYVLGWFNNRWEIQFSGLTVFYQLITATSAPNPPNGISGWTLDPSFGGQGGCTDLTSAVLPVELTQFVAKVAGQKSALSWSTASEKNNEGFDIERSVDGTAFQKIGFVKGNGTTNQPQQYTYTDALVGAVTYYRLKQVDTDGKFEYSKVVSVESNGDGLRVYPTLVSDGVLTVQGGQSDDCIVTNLLGQPVWMGKTTQQLDVSMLPKGTYLLKVGSEVTKFVKQ
jgi:hypothetical protein